LVFVIIVFFTYAIYTAFAGSRGVGIRILIICLAIFLAGMGNFKPRIILTLAIIAFIALTSVVSWPIATSMRLVTVKEQADIKSGLRLNINEINPVKEQSDLKTALRSSFNEIYLNCEDNLLENFPQKNCNFFSKILNRLGILDYAIQITTQPGDSSALEKYMNIPYIAKSVVNSALPGMPYIEAPLSTSRVISIIYRSYDELLILNSGYFSEYWTLWGLAFVLFGWWGGLITLFVGGFVLHFIYKSGGIFLANTAFTINRPSFSL
jgi:hypothetical protein